MKTYTLTKTLEINNDIASLSRRACVDRRNENKYK